MNLEQKQALMRERQLAARAPSVPPTPNGEFAERHYSVAEIAELWKLSVDTVRKLFANEPGLMVIGNGDPRPGTRRYRTLRIPESVVLRVYRRHKAV